MIATEKERKLKRFILHSGANSVHKFGYPSGVKNTVIIGIRNDKNTNIQINFIWVFLFLKANIVTKAITTINIVPYQLLSK